MTTCSYESVLYFIDWRIRSRIPGVLGIVSYNEFSFKKLPKELPPEFFRACLKTPCLISEQGKSIWYDILRRELSSIGASPFQVTETRRLYISSLREDRHLYEGLSRSSRMHRVKCALHLVPLPGV